MASGNQRHLFQQLTGMSSEMARHCAESRLELFIGFLPLELREHSREEDRLTGSGWMEDNQENMTQWIKFSGLTWDNRDRNCNHRTCTMSSAHMLCWLALCFCRTPNSRSRCVSDSSTYPWDLLLLSCLVRLRYEAFCLAFCYVLSCLAVVSWKPSVLWRGN